MIAIAGNYLQTGTHSGRCNCPTGATSCTTIVVIVPYEPVSAHGFAEVYKLPTLPPPAKRPFWPTALAAGPRLPLSREPVQPRWREWARARRGPRQRRSVMVAAGGSP